MEALAKTDMPYWYNGQLHTGSTINLPLHDPGLLYGATIFTTLRVYNKALDHPWTAWQQHIDRTARSLAAFQWRLPDWGRIRQGAEILAETYPVLRVTIFPDGREWIMGRSLPTHLAVLQQDGITAWVADASYSRVLPGHKTGNYLGCWLALQAAKGVSAQEAILIDAEGHWLESSTGNLWGWSEGQWWTPPLAIGILPGVMRSRILQGLQAQHQPVCIQPWTAAIVRRFTFLAYTNSVVEVAPIHTVLQGASSVNYNPDHRKSAQLIQAWQSITD
ncbi:aminotransferase class IV [Oscillatoria sp. CS-180]|uniref:aminotransferase class IV n=1 Tax=Oscillatoria sp. CS-180 TaxID=3021720 RepID=UPI0023301DCB|nr:aminotransferase class IV [Oscillatoria sp. CS-180]MDB9526033.1 aminotransferase class IV [Oscillatoria sp. CS-180]